MHPHSEVHTTSFTGLPGYARINRYFNWLLFLFIGVYIAGMLAYGEPFRIIDYPFSAIGRLETQNGSPNTLSFLVFSAGILMCSMVGYSISRIHPDIRFRRIMKVCACGFLLMIAPCDILNPVHILGSVLVFGTLWLYSIFLIRDIYRGGKMARAIVYHFILHSTVFSYAFLYATSSPMDPLFQKPALIGLILILKLSMLERSGSNRGNAMNMVQQNSETAT
jgi:hypothetical protein